MSITALCLPPQLSKETSYENYKKEIEVWKLLKSCTEEEQGPLVFRTLTGKAKNAALQLTVAEIGAKDGLKKILNKLDKLFLPEENQRICATLERFESFRRPPTMTMASFILEFERLHSELSSFGCTYPDGVLAFRLMKSSNMSKEHEAMCRATVETDKWSYDAVQQQIKKIFNDYVAVKPCAEISNLEDKPLPVTVSETFYTQDRYPDSNHNVNKYEESNAVYYDDFTEDQYPNDFSIEPHCNYSDPEQYDVYYGPTQNYKSPWNSNRQSYGNQSRKNPYVWKQGTGQQRFQKPLIRDPNANGMNNSPKNNPFAMNPKDYRGNPTVCRKCRSVYHWWADCPHVTPQERLNSSKKVFYNQNNVHEDLYIALFQKSSPTSNDEITSLMGETINMALIDSGCTKSCCGKKWYENYLETLTNVEAEAILNKESNAVFRFGDSEPIKATHTVLLPLKIQNMDFTLETEVVPCDVPLLLSKETMKKAGAKMNFVNDKIELFGTEVPMICTTSGHYAIPVVTSNPSNLVLYTDSDKDNQAIAKKLHAQFCHPSAKRLLKLVEQSGKLTDELKLSIQQISDKCDICKVYKKPSPKPVVSFPTASEFNETIAMDLKIYKNNEIYFLHIIDHLTRFSAAAMITSKKSEVIMKAFFKSWISIFGPPKKVLSDNGGEFANKGFMDLCQNLNINFQTTAAEAPWSNGLVERHNAIISEAVDKIIEHTNCPVEIALCWATQAKNSLQNIHGFSSYQLVFGRNPVLPSLLDSNLPALEGITESQIVADNLNAQHQARVEMIKLEASEKIRRALRAQTRTYSNTKFLSGEEVFYKRDDQKRWQGPGRVIGHDGSKVLIKIPTGLITVHSCRVILTSDAEQQRLGIKEILVEDGKDDVIEAQNKYPETPYDDAIENNIFEKLFLGGDNQNNANYDDHENDKNDSENDINNDENDNENDINDDEIVINDSDIIDRNHSENDNNDTDSDLDNTDKVKKSSDLVHTRDLPKKDQTIRYKDHNSDIWKSCIILGRGGKATSAVNKFYLNIKDLDTEIENCIDWKTEVKEWEDITESVLVTNIKSSDYSEAMQKELNSWKILETYDEVDDLGQDYITVKWIFSEKEVNNTCTKKARLVARGFQENNQDLPTNSPTCNKESIRIILSVIASLQWKIHTLDVAAAFLQGKDLDREIYIKPPKQANCPGKLWRLKKCVYGLDDASRFWYFRVKEELIRLGCEKSKYDGSLFSYHHECELQGLISLHVDDFMWAGTDSFENDIIKNLKKTFKISKESENHFKYLGVEIQQGENAIYVSQTKYRQQKLQEIYIKPERIANKHSPLTESEREELRSVIGKLNWLSTQTRPDLAYDVCELSTSLKEGTVDLLLKANKTIKKAKYNDIYLYFPKLDLSNIILRCYADASYGNLRDGGSQGGYYLELVSGSQSAPIEWQSKRLRRTPHSTLAAETIALVEGFESAFLVSNVLSEILYKGQKSIPIETITDCYSLFEAAKSETSITDKRLRIELSIIRESLSRNEFKLKWVKTGSQIADCLTKRDSDPRTLVSRITSKDVY